MLGGLFVATLGALAATMYGFMSCRFVVVRFQSNLGDFATLYNNRGAVDVVVNYQIAAGLFSWLQPIVNTNNDNNSAITQWDSGTCRGYSQTQREGFADNTFEAVRALAVVSILMGIALVGWILLLACLSMGRRYIWLLASLYLLSAILVSLSFLALQSGLCEGVGLSSSCRLDEGGLVAIAGAILWMVCFLIVSLFVVPLGKDLILLDGELRSDFEERQAARKRQQQQRKQDAEERKRQRQEQVVMQREERQQRRRRGETTPTTTPTKTKGDAEAGTPGTIAMEGDEGEMEVYLKRRLDNIEDVMDNDAYEV